MLVRDSAFTVLKRVQIIISVAVLLAIQSCECKSDCNNYDYYHRLETALINDTENLFKLQQLFFPVTTYHDPDDRLVLEVCLVVSNGQTSKEHSTNLTKKHWTFEYSSTLLTGLITPAQLYAFESITTLLLVEAAVNYRSYGAGYDETINLHIEAFPCTVSDHELYKYLAILTSWFKAYARAHGIPQNWKEEDKGYVAIWYGQWNSEDVEINNQNYHHLLRVGLLIVFIILNITVILLLLKFVPQYYKRLVMTLDKSSSHGINISWALILFTIGWNVIVYTFYIISYSFILHSFREHCFKTDPSSNCPPELSTALYRDDLVSYITKVVTLLITMVVYLMLAACTPKVSSYPIPYSMQKLCCCLSCVCCCCRSQHSKIIQTIVLWNILLFIHFTAMTTIPIGIFLFLAPARTISVLATFLTLLLSIPVVISHILEFINSQRRNTVNQSSVFCMYQCIQLTAIITLMALVMGVLLIYAQILLKGANTRGVYGITLSFLPSFILTLVGWYMKWKFSRQQEGLNTDYSSLETDSDSIEEIM